MSDWKNVQYKDGKYRTSDEGGGGASALTDLSDVNVSSPSNGQVLKYDAQNEKWVNEDESGGGNVEDVTLDGNSVVNQQGVAALTTPNVSNLKDTNISNPSNGQTLQYNATTNKWENTTPASGGNVDDVKVNGTSVVTNKVANIKSYKEVTQAEYEALPDTKLSDDVLYAIKDSQGAGGFPPLIYSTDEREVGVWYNGKPVYKLTVHNDTLAPEVNVETNIADLSSYNIDTVISIDAIDHMVRSAGSVNRWMPNASYLETFYDPSSKYLKFRQSYAGQASNDLYITLLYTKTTDVAGSGNWATSGGYAHHYSEIEQVIGTWKDGKPIYEKTITFTASSGGYVDVSNLHISKMISCVGFVTQTNGNHVNIPYGTGSGDFAVAYFNSPNNRLYCSFAGSYNVAEWNITMQYTKTTD